MARTNPKCSICQKFPQPCPQKTCREAIAHQARVGDAGTVLTSLSPARAPACAADDSELTQTDALGKFFDEVRLGTLTKATEEALAKKVAVEQEVAATIAAAVAGVRGFAAIRLDRWRRGIAITQVVVYNIGVALKKAEGNEGEERLAAEEEVRSKSLDLLTASYWLEILRVKAERCFCIDTTQSCFATRNKECGCWRTLPRELEQGPPLKRARREATVHAAPSARPVHPLCGAASKMLTEEQRAKIKDNRAAGRARAKRRLNLM